MVRRCGLFVMLAIALVFVGTSAAQEEKKASAEAVRAEKSPASFYKLDLTVRELDGAKTLNARSYNISRG